MNWHYAEDGRQVGPVSQDRVLELVRTGVIQPDTLIWQTGMAEWMPFRESPLGTPPPLRPPLSATQRACNSCGLLFPSSDLAMFGETAICTACKPMWVQRLRQGMVSAAPLPCHYAGFWIRVVAQMIDSLITGAVLGTLFFLLYGSSLFTLMGKIAEAGAQGAQPDPAETFALMAPIMATIWSFQLVALAAAVAYSAYFLVKFGATPGKMAVGIKVIRADGGPIRVGQAIGRYFAYILSGLILYIGYMMAGWDSQKRALHDMIVNTRVVYK